VWEPIILTDWMRPTSGVLARLPDRRVMQFWDPQHVVAQRIARDSPSRPDCCERKGILWDLAAVYPPGAVWSDALPPATFVNGPVVRVESLVESRLIH
jgi:hypothetical protein